MSKPLDRREFLLTAAPLSGALLVTAAETKAQNKLSFHTSTDNIENFFAAGVESTLKVSGKTAYPKFTRVDFKVNGELIGTRNLPPYQISWTPTQRGYYFLEAEVFRGTTKIASIEKGVNVSDLLYDAMASNSLINAEQSTPSFGMANLTTGIYGFPTNYVATLGEVRTITRIDAVVCATTGHKTVDNLPFPTNFRYVKARLWNNGIDGFRSSPRNGNVSNTEIGAPNLGSTTTPVITNSAGIKFYRVGWSGLQISMPMLVGLVLSIQFSHVSANDDREFVRFAHSRLSGQSMFYATGYYTSPQVASATIGAPLAVRIWAS